MAQTLLQVVELLLILATVLSGIGWIWLVWRRVRTGEPLVQPRPQQEPFWSLAEFFIGVGLFMVCSTAAVLTARRIVGMPPLDAAGQSEAVAPTSEALIAVAAASSIALLLILASMAVWMGLTRREYFERYGLWPSWSDLRLGLIASLFILPPVLQLASVLDGFVEYEHRVLDAVKQHPTLAVFFAMTFSAAIVAPLFEEFLFRALLQGGTQKLTRRLSMARLAAEAGEEGGEIQQTVSAGEVAAWPWGPVVISSVTFAIMHMGQGAAPIALFFFALALGYLYRQTGRLWPCIVVHFMLNTISMIAFSLTVAAEAP